jgi:hypothetical protein
MALLVPKGWRDFQHYHDRCPPWIKLPRSLLTNRAFMTLPLASKALATMLWLLASEAVDGSFDGDVAELAFRLHMQERELKSALEPLLQAGLFVQVAAGASAALAAPSPSLSASASEPRRKATTAAEAEQPPGAPPELWSEFLAICAKKRKPLTPRRWAAIAKRIAVARTTVVAALTTCVESGWADWQASWNGHGRAGERALNDGGERIEHPRNAPVPYDSPAGNCECPACRAARAKGRPAGDPKHAASVGNVLPMREGASA